MKQVKELSITKQKKPNTHTHTNQPLIDTDNNILITRGKGSWGHVEEGKEGINGNGRCRVIRVSQAPSPRCLGN